MIFDIACMGPDGKIFNPPINLERRGCKYKMLSLVKKLQDQYGPGYQFFLTPVGAPQRDSVASKQQLQRRNS